eukprot:symbB.v1.2.005209.t1/scaffold266.1/size251003/6
MTISGVGKKRPLTSTGNRHLQVVPGSQMVMAADFAKRRKQQLIDAAKRTLDFFCDDACGLAAPPKLRIALQSALVMAEHQNLEDAPSALRCRKRLQDLQLQKPLCEAMTAVLKSKDVVQARQLLEMLQQAKLEPSSPQWLPELAGGQLQTELCELVEAEQLRLEQLQLLRQAAQARRQEAQERRQRLGAEALRKQLAAVEAQHAAEQAIKDAQLAQHKAKAEEVEEMAECLVLCDMGLEELTEMQLRCQSLAEQCETLEIGGELHLIAVEMGRKNAGALLPLAERLKKTAERLRKLGTNGVVGKQMLGLDSLRMEDSSHLLRQVEDLQTALTQERLMTSSLKAELETMKSLKGTGLLIS